MAPRTQTSVLYSILLLIVIMAENSGDPSFDEFYNLLPNFLPLSFVNLYCDNRERLFVEFECLPASRRQQFLRFLRDNRASSRMIFLKKLSVKPFAVDSVFKAVREAINHENLLAMALAGISFNGDPGAFTYPGVDDYDFPLNSLLLSDAAESSIFIGEFGAISSIHGNSPDHDMNNSAHIKSHSQRPADGGELTSGEGSNPAEQSATDQVVFEALLSVHLTIAENASQLVNSLLDSALPVSVRNCIFLTGCFASVAFINSLAGLSLSTMLPDTLPFGCNPKRMAKIMHYVGIFFTFCAFVGAVCHNLLRYDPMLMWITLGSASAVFLALIIFINWKR